nr:MAG TPA: hypothetical protein [Caudoviricetes sp.]
MKTKLTTRHSSLQDDGTLNLHVPHSWSELTQEQLRYVLFLLTQGWEEWKTRTYLFARFAGIGVLNEKKDGWLCEVETHGGKKVRFFLELWQVQSFCEAFDYIFNGNGADNRLESIGLFKAVELELYDYPFEYYLMADNYFQQYMMSDKSSEEPLSELARCLYLDGDGRMPDHIECTVPELMGVFLWFVWVKHNFSEKFPHLFKPAGKGGEDYDMVGAMNAQIRALTGGDITKEEIIRKADVWRALTELDAKAREVEELNKKLKKS